LWTLQQFSSPFPHIVSISASFPPFFLAVVLRDSALFFSLLPLIDFLRCGSRTSPSLSLCNFCRVVVRCCPLLCCLKKKRKKKTTVSLNKMPASLKVGTVVTVTFTNKVKNEPHTVVGVVETVDSAQELCTVFVGNQQSWSVPTASLTPLALPPTFSWTAGDTQKVRSAAATAFFTATAPAATQPVATSSTKHYQAELEAPIAVAPSTSDDNTTYRGNASLQNVGTSSFHSRDNYSFESNASCTNVLYEINARLTGLCNWSSPPLTALFLVLLYLWLAVEGSGGLLWRVDSPPSASVAVYAVQRCVIAVARTLSAVVLCTCVSMAPRQPPASTFWLLFPLMVVSFGGLIPVQLWHALVVGCFPIRLQASESGSATAPAAAPIILWVGKAAVDGVRCVARGLSKAMIATGESLRTVSE
jgi:hypothetical protein